MKSKTPRAIAGLALALLLALVGGASGALGGGDSNDEDSGEVVAASVTDNTSPVTADLTEKLLLEPTTTTSEPEPEPAPEPEPEPAPEPAPTTTAPPAPTYAAGSIEGLIESYFGPHTQKALSVAYCESRLDPSAMSPGGGNHGLFQINNVHRGNFEAVTGVPWSGRYGAEANTRFAKWLFDQSGWGPWACA